LKNEEEIRKDIEERTRSLIRREEMFRESCKEAKLSEKQFNEQMAEFHTK